MRRRAKPEPIHYYTRGPAPRRVQEGCTFGPGLLAKLALDKCADSTPIYRVDKQMRRCAVPIARSTLNDNVLLAGDVATPLLDLNARTMRKYKASRRELFERLDKPALMPLPTVPFEACTWKKVGLNIDYHVAFEDHLYSAPHALRTEDVELWLRATTTTVEIFHGRERVAAHVRGYVRGGFTTTPEHMPSSHRAHAEWTPSRILGWADQVGPHTRALCEVILRERRPPEWWGFRSCLGLFRLAKMPARRLDGKNNVYDARKCATRNSYPIFGI